MIVVQFYKLIIPFFNTYLTSPILISQNNRQLKTILYITPIKCPVRIYVEQFTAESRRGVQANNHHNGHNRSD